MQSLTLEKVATQPELVRAHAPPGGRHLHTEVFDIQNGIDCKKRSRFIQMVTEKMWGKDPPAAALQYAKNTANKSASTAQSRPAATCTRPAILNTTNSAPEATIATSAALEPTQSLEQRTTSLPAIAHMRQIGVELASDGQT